jgi:tetratricopeptide (TPR) repeat protein
MKKIIYLIVLFFSLGLNAQNNEQLFEAGNKYFSNKEYELALKNYLAIENKKAFSVELYYNIGNTYFRLNEYANSILYYERGLKLDPKNKNLNLNLKVAKSRLKGEVYIVPNFFLINWKNSIANLFTPNIWKLISILLLTACGVVFVIYYFSINQKTILFYCFILLTLLFSISIFSGFTRQNQINDKAHAIVFGDRTIGKDSPEENSSDKIKMFKGQKIRIIDKDNNWVKVKTEDGKEAWIEDKDIIII